jgi:hypothetical protein
MRTITAVASPTHTSSLSVALRNERASELHECELVQALLDNDERQRLMQTFGVYTMGADQDWVYHTAGSLINGETNLHLTLTAACPLILKDTGAFAGLAVEVRTGASAYILTVTDSAENSLTTMTQNKWARFMWTGSTWYLWGGPV